MNFISIGKYGEISVCGISIGTPASDVTKKFPCGQHFLRRIDVLDYIVPSLQNTKANIYFNIAEDRVGHIIMIFKSAEKGVCENDYQSLRNLFGNNFTSYELKGHKGNKVGFVLKNDIHRIEIEQISGTVYVRIRANNDLIEKYINYREAESKKPSLFRRILTYAAIYILLTSITILAIEGLSANDKDPERLGQYIYIDLNDCVHSRRCEATQDVNAKTELQLNCRNLKRLTHNEAAEYDDFFNRFDFCAICFSDDLYDSLQNKIYRIQYNK